MPGAGGPDQVHLWSSGASTYSGLSWPSSGPRALQPRWYKAGADQRPPAPSLDTKICPKPRFRQYSPHAIQRRKALLGVGPAAGVCGSDVAARGLQCA